VEFIISIGNTNTENGRSKGSLLDEWPRIIPRSGEGKKKMETLENILAPGDLL
jgi:hypothetical protein